MEEAFFVYGGRLQVDYKIFIKVIVAQVFMDYRLTSD